MKRWIITGIIMDVLVLAILMIMSAPFSEMILVSVIIWGLIALIIRFETKS